ncbi:hypothetical protein HD806DRAFT_449648 [Xylariaceae sp. AK1471]|nr:hypothetical protein HD806DRAFT_449648 [Xylariaceae sp. AK1471]
MSQAPTRRPSTGGLPPIKMREEHVIEQVPSHHNTPCFTAWTREVIVKVPEGWSAGDFEISDKRPDWGVQVYDTSPGADDLERLRCLAERLFRESGEDGGWRLDLWGLPLNAGTSDQERIERCKGHFLREVEARDGEVLGMPSGGFLGKWQRGILIIEGDGAGNESEVGGEGEKGFLAVCWDVLPSYLEMLAREYGKDYEEPEVGVFRYTRSELGQVLAGFRYGV